MLTDEEVRNGFVEGVLHDCYYEGDVKLTPDGKMTAKEFLEWKAEVERAAAARALDLAADAWTQGAWSDHIPPRGADRPQIILGVAQSAGDWLRARAAEIRERKSDGES